jgi:acylphosphatase
MAENIARTVYYAGRVQGVGFRLTAVRIASHHPVTGWVKNLRDGRVQVFVEGQPEAVDRFLADVRAYWKGSLESEEAQDGAATGAYPRFDIAY